MNFDWKKPFLLLVIIAALVATGCGGDDSNDGGDTSASSTSSSTTEASGDPLSAEDYSAKLGEILQPLGTDLQDIGSATSAGSTNQDAVDGVSEASDRLQSSIDELSAIVPPEEAADAHEALVSSLQGFKDAADEFAAADPDDDEAITGAVTDLQDAVLTFQTDFQDAISQIQAAGVKPPSETP